MRPIEETESYKMGHVALAQERERCLDIMVVCWMAGRTPLDALKWCDILLSRCGILAPLMPGQDEVAHANERLREKILGLEEDIKRGGPKQELPREFPKGEWKGDHNE